MALFRRTTGGFFLSHNATLTGDLTIGADANFWFGVVVRGDVAPVTIGARVNVQDNTVIHCDTGVPNVIADDVSIGHGAIVHGASIGQGTLIGMGARLLARTQIGEECLVAAGAVVPPGFVAPPRTLVLGVPAKVVRPLNDEDLKYVRWISGHYVRLAQRYAAGEFERHD